MSLRNHLVVHAAWATSKPGTWSRVGGVLPEKDFAVLTKQINHPEITGEPLPEAVLERLRTLLYDGRAVIVRKPAEDGYAVVRVPTSATAEEIAAMPGGQTPYIPGAFRPGRLVVETPPCSICVTGIGGSITGRCPACKRSFGPPAPDTRGCPPPTFTAWAHFAVKVERKRGAR